MSVLYSRHPELRLTAVEDEGVVLHLGSLRYFTVNETGRTILQALEAAENARSARVRGDRRVRCRRRRGPPDDAGVRHAVRGGEADRGGGALSAAIPFVWRARAIVAATIVPPLLEVLSLARLERMLRAAARVTRTRSPSDIDSAQWVDRTLVRLPNPWKLSCLRRAAVLYYLLRSAGRDVSLCIGVRRDEKGELLAHAWLMLDGVLYVERGNTVEIVSDYTLIAQFP